MIAPERIRHFPPRPPSEVEWEELLVRLEIAPRALRLAVEDARAPHGALLGLLQAATALEAGVQDAVYTMATGDAPEIRHEAPAAAAEPLLEQIARLRRRSFAMVQRRGLEVWEWRAAAGPWAGASAYQLLSAVVEWDAGMLAAVRAAGRAA